MKQDEQVELPPQLLAVLTKLTGELLEVQRAIEDADARGVLGAERRQLQAISDGLRRQLGKLAQGLRQALMAGFEGAGVGVEGAENSRDPAVLALLEEILSSVAAQPGMMIRLVDRGSGQVEVEVEYASEGLTDGGERDGRD